MNEKNTQAIIESLKNYFSEEIKDGKEVFLSYEETDPNNSANALCF